MRKKSGKFVVIESDRLVDLKSVLNNLKSIFQNDEFIFTGYSGEITLADAVSVLTNNNPLHSFEWRSDLLLQESVLSERLSKIILPATESGRNVICSRFDAFVFSRCLPSIEMDNIAFFNRVNFAVTGLRRPTLYIYLNIPNIEDLKQFNTSGTCLKDYNEVNLNSESFHSECYLRFFNEVILKGEKVKYVDATDSFSNVLTNVKNVITEHLKNLAP